MQFEIRAFESTDFDGVLNIFRNNVPQYFSEDEEKDLVQYLQTEIEDYFVVQYQDQIVGAGGINYSKDKSQGHFSWAMVDLLFQGILRVLIYTICITYSTIPFEFFYR